MDINRIYTIIISEFNAEKLKLESDIELTVNTALEADEKIKKIKFLVDKLTNLENNISKFTNMVNSEPKKD